MPKSAEGESRQVVSQRYDMTPLDNLMVGVVNVSQEVKLLVAWFCKVLPRHSMFYMVMVSNTI